MRVVAACLLAAALVAGWPSALRRTRRLSLVTRRAGAPVDGRPTGRRAAGRWLSAVRRLAVAAGVRDGGVPSRAVLVSAVVAGALLGTLLGGPVVAMAVSAYGALAVRAVLRRVASQRDRRRRLAQLDALCALAADLRAGRPVPEVPAADAGDRIGRLARAAGRLAEQTGAPLADLLDRIEADIRAGDRAVAAAAAQAAGARATAWLLAALPAGGIALGYGIGADPLAVLLHTPVGAACAVGAIVLQFAGLTWADRLSSGPAGVA